MSIRYYDDALLKKIRDWVIDPKVNILGPTDPRQTFALNSDRTKDKALTLPLISLSRVGYCDIQNPAKKALSYDGGHFKANDERSGVLNAVPIKLSYQLDIYTKHYVEADEYARNFIFNLINYPTVTINIPYQNANIKHNSTINLNGRVSDNSDQNGRLAPDQFYKISLNFDINDAYMFSIPVMYNYEILEDSSILMQDNTNKGGTN